MIKFNILITGGAGFIGSNLVRRLAFEKKYNITVLDNFSEQIHPKNSIKSTIKSLRKVAHVVKGDVRSKKKLSELIPDQDYIIHLAAETGTGQSMYDISKYVDVNVNGTAILLETICEFKGNLKKFMLASSRAVYGEGKYLCPTHRIVYPESRKYHDMIMGDFAVKCPYCSEIIEPIATDEESAYRPNSFYALTKKQQEELSLLFAKTYSEPVTIFRFQNVYGPGQSLINPYTGILSIFSNLILSRKNLDIFEDGKESRDFIYIDDVVEAVFLSIENRISDNKIYNVGTGVPVSIFDVATSLVDEFDSDTRLFISKKFRIGDIRTNFADIEKIKNDLGFIPQTFFKTGIKKFVEWVKRQGIVSDNKYQESIDEMKKKGLLH